MTNKETNCNYCGRDLEKNSNSKQCCPIDYTKDNYKKPKVNKINDTLKERESVYGEFEDNADITQELIKVIGNAPSNSKKKSKKSGEFMPDILPGREIIKLSESDLTTEWNLCDAYLRHPYANLLGGQTLALEAINKNYITDIFLTYSPIELETGIKFNLDKIIEEKFNKVQKITIDGVTVYHWKLK